MELDRYPTGIVYVMVNGRFTVDGGKPTGALPVRSSTEERSTKAQPKE